MTAETVLASVPLFAALAADHLRSIAAAGRTKTVATGETVFREGDASDGLYIVLSGKVRIYKQSDDGNEVDLLTGAAGEYFGNSR
jgi:CRP-like cAMP-binding protein